MRRFLLTAYLYLLFWFGAQAQHGWQWLNPQPSGFDDIKITFTDSQHGFMLNYVGELIRTNDQGAHWQNTDHFQGAACMDIAHSTGVIAGNGGLLYVSSDNGSTWNLVYPSLRDNFQWVSIVSRDTFFLGNQGGTIYQTNDRGQTMTAIHCPTLINCFTFLDSKTGFIGGPSTLIYKTTDGGQSWIMKKSSDTYGSHVLGFQFLNKDTGYAFKQSDSLLRTYDGGNHWKSFPAIQAGPPIQFINPKTGFLAGDGGLIFRTDDSGASWNSITPPNGAKDGNQIYSMYFFDDQTGFTVGGLGRILKTINGGQSWNEYAPTYWPITAAAFPTPQIGYLSSSNNTLKTIDGGQTWSLLSPPPVSSFGSSTSFTQGHFTSPDTGYFFATGQVRELRTTDGGQNWTTFDPASADWYMTTGEFYLDNRTGFVTLEQTQGCCGGILLKTIDGGSSWSTVWQNQLQYNAEWLGRLFFLDSLNGYALRYQQLMKTTDGGKTWSVAYTHPYYAFTDLYFSDTQNGILSNQDGQILFTHDGGATITTPYYTNAVIGNINAMRFFNKQIGYFTAGNQFGPGSYGGIYKTMDGGNSWQLSVAAGGNSILFTADSNVIVAGFGGELVKAHIADWQVDSLTALFDNACGENFSVVVGAALSDADSISIVVNGPNGKSDTIPTTPGQVHNAISVCKASARGFIPNAVYSARVRLRHGGVFQMSDPVWFTGQGFLQPYITDSLDYLVSSADSGNQWYRNGVAIPSGLGRRYKLDSSGTYTVQVKIDSCFSAMSYPTTITLDCPTEHPTPFPTITDSSGVLISSYYQNYQWYRNDTIILGANDQRYQPTTSGGYYVCIKTVCPEPLCSNPTQIAINGTGPMLIGPNPVNGQLVINNADGDMLDYLIYNMNGRTISMNSSSATQVFINTEQLPSGQYVLRVFNRNTGAKTSFIFVKP
jgi:photosystem II stability/assembly factor-like uncharacterized protein